MTEQHDISRKPRIEFIDLAKGICILLVVQFHVAQETGAYDPDCWFSILTRNLRMPLYYLLSGMFFKNYGGFFLTALKKFNKLMIPFFFFILLAYIAFQLPARAYQGDDLIPSSLGSAYHWFISLNDSVWFLFSLFLINLLFFPIVVHVRNEWLRLAIVAALAASAPPICKILNINVITSVFNCIPFFYLGWLSARRSDFLYRHIRKRHLILFSMCCIALAALIISLTGGLKFDPIAPCASPSGILLYTSATLFVAGLLAICKAIVSLPLISWVGRYSIILLGTHRIFLYMTATFMSFIGKYVSIEKDILFFWPLLFIITIACCCIAIPVLRKYFPKFCAQEDLIPLPQKITPKTCIHE